jgi:hypothetical protein
METNDASMQALPRLSSAQAMIPWPIAGFTAVMDFMINIVLMDELEGDIGVRFVVGASKIACFALR